MENEVKLSKFFSIDRETLFNYFIDKNLLEQWAYPDGMSLKIPELDAKVGGSYRWEHTAKDGTYVCTGRFKDIVPGEKIVQLDALVKAPDGKKVFENLESIYTFTSKPGGSEVQVIQRGFEDEAGAVECEQSWSECFNHLSELIGRESGLRPQADLGGPEAGMYD